MNVITNNITSEHLAIATAALEKTRQLLPVEYQQREKTLTDDDREMDVVTLAEFIGMIKNAIITTDSHDQENRENEDGEIVETGFVHNNFQFPGRENGEISYSNVYTYIKSRGTCEFSDDGDSIGQDPWFFDNMGFYVLDESGEEKLCDAELAAVLEEFCAFNDFDI